MISYKGYDNIIKEAYESGNEQVFANWEKLSDNEKRKLLNDLKNVDYTLLEKLYSNTGEESKPDFSPAPYISQPNNDEERNEFLQARKKGIEYIKQGKVAAFIVAGGQGSRLGYDGPKGKYPSAPISNKTLFQIHGEKILKYSRKYDVSIPWLIMTSEANHDETESYFKENSYFGLDEKDIFIFAQNMIPSLDSKGKLILQNKNSVFKNPDGHGGSLTALHTSGVLKEMLSRGIEIISYFQVDNPIVKIIDPEFIGFHLINSAEISSKAIKKTGPDEKVGVFVRFDNGKTGVMEYSDLSEEMANRKESNGDLSFSSGSIAIHLFNCKFIQKITSGNEVSLPFHIAKKKIAAFQNGKIEEIDGFKFEKFVFDALELTDKNVIFETVREEEFAPIKNAKGVDSAESSKELMIALHKKWLINAGIPVPNKVKVLEISPLLAVESEDLEKNLKIPSNEKVYLDVD